MKTIADQIKDLEATRAAKVAAQGTVLQKASAEGRSTNEAEAQEFDDLQSEIEQIDKDLARYRKAEQNQLAAAKAVNPSDARDAALSSRSRNSSIQIVEPKLDKGIGFARLVGCFAASKGVSMQALQIAKHRFPNDEKLHSALSVLGSINGEQLVKATADIGTTTDSDFAAPLVNYSVLASEFIEYLRPQTVIGRIPGLRNVPFNVRVPRQTGGATAQWVGEGAPKPVGQQAFDYVSLGYTKLAIISAITQELARFSQPNADTLIRNDLAAAVVQQMDADFLEPTNAGTANVKPASITNGIVAIESTGSSEAAIRADVKALFNAFIAANVDPTGLVWLMPTSVALALSLAVNALGQPAFPGITMNGGTFFGLPVVTAQSAGFVSDMSPTETMVVLVKASDILIADDGQVTIDTSSEASVQMDTAPTNPVVAATVLISAFQQNLLFIRAERFVNWVRARSAAVAVLGNVKWAS
jgi:HK97 family phage major capsid protein